MNTARTIRVIDVYAHCGQSKYHPLPDLEQAMACAGVEQAVLVQHLGEYDNGYIGECVASRPDRFAGVCLVDHTLPTACNDLGRWAATGSFRGVRLLMEILETNRELWQAATTLRLNLLVFDPAGIVPRLGLLAEFLDEHPAATVILSHLGMPDAADDPGFARQAAIFELSRYPHVYFQISGMHMFCLYPYAPMMPLISRALATFGSDRVLWGSNYPVLGGNEEYTREADLLRSGQLPIDRGALPAVAATTAEQVWFSNRTEREVMR